MFSQFHGKVDNLNNLHDINLDITHLKEYYETGFDEKLPELDTTHKINFSNVNNTTELVSIDRNLFNKLINNCNNCNKHKNKSIALDTINVDSDDKANPDYSRVAYDLSTVDDISVNKIENEEYIDVNRNDFLLEPRSVIDDDWLEVSNKSKKSWAASKENNDNMSVDDDSDDDTIKDFDSSDDF